MNHYYIIHKPYNMLSQFTPEAGRETLKDLFNFPNEVYPLGRLDADSEGLLILTNDKKLNHLLLNPAFKHQRTYLAQVEGEVNTTAIELLNAGVAISVNGKQYQTLPAKAAIITRPAWLIERKPPVRFRKNIPTSFLTLTLHEGKNHQVRKMTAAAGFPTLRLIRIAIEGIVLDNLQPGAVKEIARCELLKALGMVE